MALQNYLPIVFWEGSDPQNLDTYDFHAFAVIKNATPAQLAATGRVCVMKTPTKRESVFVWIPADNDHTLDELRYFCHGWGLQTYHIASRRGYIVLSTYVLKVLRDPQLADLIVAEDKSTILATNAPLAQDLATGTVTLEQINNGTININTHPNYEPHWNIKSGHVVGWWGQNTQTPSIRRFFNRSSNLICMHTARVVSPVFKAAKSGILGTGPVQLYLSKATQMSSKNGTDVLRQDTTLEALMNVPAYKACPTIGVYRLKPRPNPAEIPVRQPIPAELIQKLQAEKPMPAGAPTINLALSQLLAPPQPTPPAELHLIELTNGQPVMLPPHQI